MSLETPIAFVIFNRPSTTHRVFQAITRARPKKLFVIADGPRAGHPDDAANCAAARAVVDQVDWPCEVLKDFSNVNLCCGRRIATGIDWVFSQVEEAIILEDDCLPSDSFFPFCEQLLRRYRDDQRVMHISGNNFQKGLRRSLYSYYFSRLTHNWGWATWRRAWRHFDFNMACWSELKASGLLGSLFADSTHRVFWENWIDSLCKSADDVWDVQWNVACWKQGGLGILPEVNLVSNIGAGSDATHTQSATWYMGLPALELSEVLHPPFCLPNRAADEFAMKAVFNCESDEEVRMRAMQANRLSVRGRRFLGRIKRLLLGESKSRAT